MLMPAFLLDFPNIFHSYSGSDMPSFHYLETAKGI